MLFNARRSHPTEIGCVVRTLGLERPELERGDNAFYRNEWAWWVIQAPARSAKQALSRLPDGWNQEAATRSAFALGLPIRQPWTLWESAKMANKSEGSASCIEDALATLCQRKTLACLAFKAGSK
jgi:hypothetical protein